MQSWVDKRYDHLTEDGKIRDLTIEDLEKAGIRLQEALDSPELKKIVDASKEDVRVFSDQMKIEKACEISMEASSVSEPGGKVKLASWAGNPELEKGVDVPSFDLDLPEHKDAEQPYALVESVENLAPCVQVALMNKHLNMSNICPNPKISDQKLNQEAYAKKAQKARYRAKENAKQREAALEEFRHLGQDHSSRQIIEVIQALDTEDTQHPPPKYRKTFVSSLKKKIKDKLIKKKKETAAKENNAEEPQANKAKGPGKGQGPGRGRTSGFVAGLVKTIRSKADDALKNERKHSWTA
jgi:hypothetical protein